MTRGVEDGRATTLEPEATVLRLGGFALRRCVTNEVGNLMP
jgi:hypothetical protein